MRTINDKIYGKTKIGEPVLLELLKSHSVLRLKNISQYGIPDKYYHFKNFNRYEHSVGVMILLRRLGATLEEQVAGLLHDLSVSSFSHIADWVFSQGRKGREGFHDSIHKKFVVRTEIPKILRSHNFPLERMLEEDNFTLLEKKIPNLCADRVDYALREFKYWLNPRIVKICFGSLVNFNGEIVFTNERTAYLFANNFLELQTKHWGAHETMMRYYLFSRMMKRVLYKKTLSKRDFYKLSETKILEKVESNKDDKVKKMLSLLRKKSVLRAKLGVGEKLVKKFRYVDPKILIDGKLVRLTKASSIFPKLLRKHREINRQGLDI